MQQSGKQEVTGANVLVAIFSEKQSQAVYFLSLLDVTRLDVVNYISHGMTNADEAERRFGVAGDESTEGRRMPAHSQSTLPISISSPKMARSIPLIGRRVEIERTVEILCRRRKNNPLYVGEAGVGKTALAEGLARLIVRRQSAGGSERRHDLCAGHGQPDRRALNTAVISRSV